ncbi:MAG: putative tricarboxylic transport membrane protein [Verrucomicrobiales bacterium]|jgi:putative tricarboxylic transport membrane protein
MSADIFFWTTLGTIIGLIVGAIPGLTGAMAIALAVPLTYGMDKAPALALLVAMYVGSVSGGLITATLLKIPGTPASIMTTLDAYPMAAKGRPRRALALGVISSLFGGIVAWFVLVALSGVVSKLSLAPLELFSLIVVSLVLVAVISKGAMLVGLFSAFLGMLFALPRINPATSEPRLTFGVPELSDGFQLLPVLIGLFAISESVRLVVTKEKREIAGGGGGVLGGTLPKMKEWIQQLPNLIRSSMIGSFVGILPAIGANIGSLLSYGAAKSSAKDRDEFGKGADSAIVASESANNATVGGALVPLIAIGIPGSVIDAILLGAFLIHGIQPGPWLFENNPEIVSTISWSYLFANLVMFVVMWFSINLLMKLVKTPRWVLVPAVLLFSVIGSFAIANRPFDVWVMLSFGGLGIAMNRFGIPLAPFVLGFVLFPIAEWQLVQGLGMNEGNWLALLTNPISAGLLILALVLLVAPFIKRRSTASV